MLYLEEKHLGQCVISCYYCHYKNYFTQEISESCCLQTLSYVQYIVYAIIDIQYIQSYIQDIQDRISMLYNRHLCIHAYTSVYMDK